MYFFLNLFHSCIFGNSLEKRKNNSFLLGRMRCTSPAHARKQARSPFPSLPSLPSGPRCPRDPAISCWPSTRAPPVGNASPKSPSPACVCAQPSPAIRCCRAHRVALRPATPCALHRDRLVLSRAELSPRGAVVCVSVACRPSSLRHPQCPKPRA
jgi:hypothetical protein